MGWERKRGKLAEFNRLLRGATDTSFTIQQGDLVDSADGALRHHAGLRHAAADGNGPPPGRHAGASAEQAALRSPAAARHRGLRRAAAARRGRASVSANRTRFSQVSPAMSASIRTPRRCPTSIRISSTRAATSGKGIYDVDAFEAALADRVPENALLSHDLFEGVVRARRRSCTDIHLVDDYPAHYLAFAARQHRWVRGDWQIVRWLWCTVPDANGRHRSEYAAGHCALEDSRQPAPQPAAAGARGAARCRLDVPARIAGVRGQRWRCWCSPFRHTSRSARSIGSRARGVPLREHLARGERHDRHERAPGRLLDHHAGASERRDARRDRPRARGDARSPVDDLLEWVTADRAATTDASIPHGSAKDVAGAGPRRGDRRAGARGRAGSLLAGQPPIVILWFISPIIAYATGQAAHAPRARPSTPAERADAAHARAADVAFLRRVDRAGRSSGWFPTTIRRIRKDLIAHRTSPTNIGLQLLSTVAAFDFGYLSVTDRSIGWSPRSIRSCSMPRYRGHFYNWYDTRDAGAAGAGATSRPSTAATLPVTC